MYNTAKARLTEKFTVLSAYIRKKQRSKINSLSSTIRNKEIKPKTEVINIRAEISEIKNTKQLRKSVKSKTVHIK